MTFKGVVSVKFGKSEDIDLRYFPLKSLEEYGVEIPSIPNSIKIILESVLRHHDGKYVRDQDIEKLIEWESQSKLHGETPFYVSRIIMHDLGLANLIDLATLRENAHQTGIAPESVNPVLPVDLVIDHSVQVDFYGSNEAFKQNQLKEFQRNKERYEFIKWASKAFKNLRVLPPSVGIIHQVNLEYLSTLVSIRDINGEKIIFPDTVIGMDSHTPMINGTGILGWGVGGIEAMSAMLGEPLSLRIPEVIGVRVKGKLGAGVIATDIVLKLTEMLRKKGVVGKFIEFFGESVSQLSVFDRATISNMCPEYGATVGLFPIDEKTIDFLRLTGRPNYLIDLVQEYYKRQGMFGSSKNTLYNDIVELDLSEIEPSIAGPNLPHKRIALSQLPESFRQFEASDSANYNYTNALREIDSRSIEFKSSLFEEKITDGDIVIASITSCTNTSNPRAMIGAGILAKKAFEKGMKINKKIKTSLSPGSRVVEDYYKKSGLQDYLNALGFNITGFGCMTCGGKGGPLEASLEGAITKGGIRTVAVTSSNRNFESRINRHVKANYIMSPQLVIAMALAGNVRNDYTKEPLGMDRNGKPVFLKEIWPSDEEITEIITKFLTNRNFREVYEQIGKYSELWDELETQEGMIYKWDPKSTYIKRSPFMDREYTTLRKPGERIVGIYTLLVLGDNVSTDHISPESYIPKDSDAGNYLINNGVKYSDFNTFGSRRGNPEVKVRGAFSNNRIRNFLVNVEGGFTCHFPDGEVMSIFQAATRYREENIQTVVFAGSNYGMGSSRDWAAKGTNLLGICAVVAKDFERIHRDNLVRMGVLPLQFPRGVGYEDIDIDFSKKMDLELPNPLNVGSEVTLRYKSNSGIDCAVLLKMRLDTSKEIEYFMSGGIMPYMLQKIIKYYK